MHINYEQLTFQRPGECNVRLQPTNLGFFYTRIYTFPVRIHSCEKTESIIFFSPRKVLTCHFSSSCEMAELVEGKQLGKHWHKESFPKKAGN